MRCHEVRDRLNQLSPGQEPGTEIAEHLKSCQACARLARAAGELQQAFSEASTPDEAGGLGWPEQVRRVETILTRTNQPKEIPIMSTLRKHMQRKPRLSISLATVAVLLLIATLIPLKMDQTVGFEVAVAGVDRDLALDQQKLTALLERLGLSEATFDVTGCEATCNLVISDLQSETDANMVRIAFEEIGKDQVLIELQEVHLDVSGSALEHAVDHISVWIGGDKNHVDEFELQQIVIDQLGTCSDSMKTLFFVEEGDQKATIMLSGGDATCMEDVMSKISSHDLSQLEEYYMVDGHLTEEVLAEAAAQGWHLELSEDSGTVILSLSGSDSTHDHGMPKASELPDGYTLSQNYPNPFNPSTTINYTIPQAERVTIDIYNIRGQKVRTLVDETKTAGDHSVEWNATDDAGHRVASGVYLYRLMAGELTQTKKMTLVK